MTMNRQPIKGGLSLKGVTHIPHYNSGGSGVVSLANRFYILNVQRQSLTDKRAVLREKLNAVDQQLSDVNGELKVLQKKYGGITRKMGGKNVSKNGRAPSGRKNIALEF